MGYREAVRGGRFGNGEGMGNKYSELDKKLRGNVGYYHMSELFMLDTLKGMFDAFGKLQGVSLKVEDAQGTVCYEYGSDNTGLAETITYDFNLGQKKLGTASMKYADDSVVNLFVVLCDAAEKLGEQTYFHKECRKHIEDFETHMDSDDKLVMQGAKEDALTGVLNRPYFNKRMQIIDRSEVVPTALINLNINDWKYANDNFGDDESDRLIAIVAELIRQEAKPEYVIGRTDGDVFHVIIPLAEQEEAQTFCAKVKAALEGYDDECLSPSVAAGVVMKTNVEQKLQDLMGDAEYEMFADKYEMKQEPCYQARLKRWKVE